jgi:membrane protease YdiL (CAAX protease family)
MLTGFVAVELVTFFPIALILLLLAYLWKSPKPLIATSLLFAAHTFDSFLRSLPFLFPFLGNYNWGGWNWIGGILSFLWPWPIIFYFKWFSAEEVGLKLRYKTLWLGLIFGLILGGWNALEGYLLNDLPSEHLAEAIAMQLFVPAFSEELIFRGLFFAILARYLSAGWSITLVSILFINDHLVSFDRTTGILIWIGSLDLIGNILIATTALAYLRLKTNSIWPGVICHSLINSLPFITAYFTANG